MRNCRCQSAAGSRSFPGVGQRPLHGRNVSCDPAPVMHRALALLCLGCGPTSAFASSHAQACINVLWNAWLSVDIRAVLGGLLEERANVPAARGERLQHEHRQRGHRHGAQFVSGVVPKLHGDTYAQRRRKERSCRPRLLPGAGHPVTRPSGSRARSPGARRLHRPAKHHGELTLARGGRGCLMWSTGAGGAALLSWASARDAAWREGIMVAALDPFRGCDGAAHRVARRRARARRLPRHPARIRLGG